MAEATRVSVTLVEGYQFVASNHRNHSVVLDTRPSSGGSDSGPTPMELLLMSYGGCTGVDVVHILRKKRQALTGFRVELLGRRAEEDPRIYQTIQVEYVLSGKRLNTRAIESAIRLSENKYCSVRAMMKESVEITSTYRVESSDA